MKLKYCIRNIIIASLMLVLPLFLPRKALAVKFTLTAPSGTLTRGQEAQFIVSIDTQGETLTTAQTSVSYITQYLEYISTTPGTFFPNVSTTQPSSGMLDITGNVNTGEAGKNGQGIFAYVTFKIVAAYPGETEVCTIVSPTPSPTPGGPTSPPGGPTQVPTSVVTSAPSSSELPRSGVVENLIILSVTGVSFVSLGIGIRKFKT